MKKAVEACALLCCLVLPMRGQQQSNNMTLNVTDIEANIDYSGSIPATAAIRYCEAVNWSYSLEWGDGQTSSPTTDSTQSHVNDKNYLLRKLGAYSLGFSHEYQTANTTPGYTVALHDDGQCAGFVYPVGVFHDKYTQILRVWGRVPVQTVKVSPAAAKRGSVVTVDIQLSSIAPRSGTRVFLYDPSKVLEDLPGYRVVPPGAAEIKTTFKIKASAPVGVHRIGAWTAKTQQNRPPADSLRVIR